MENGGNSKIIQGELAKFCQMKSYREGEVIYSPCQRDTAAYFIQQGRVKLYHLDESGKRLTLAILGEGNLFGEMALLGEGHRESSAEALEDSVCWVIEREKLMARAKSYPALVLHLLRLFLHRMSEIQERLKEMVFKDLETRLARTLLHLAQKHGHRGQDRWEIDLKITHQELAELVGGTRENVTMILNRFESEGLIAKQRFQIAITDAEQLAERAALARLNEGISKN
jgi:CRP/FNR family cyclic AMP-dependent transcriptional regulator